jgi:hypothetical protein
MKVFENRVLKIIFGSVREEHENEVKCIIRSFIICNSSMHGRVYSVSRNLNFKEHLEDMGKGWRMILKSILKIQGLRCELNSYGSG